MDRHFYTDRANIVFVSEWLARNARDAQQRDSMHFMTDDLNSRVSALSRDLREAAISGEAKDPDAAMRIAGDLERMVAGEYLQEW